jgi:hypothetical protein
MSRTAGNSVLLIALAVGFAGTAASVRADQICYYEGSKFSEGAKHKPSIPQSTKDKFRATHKKADLTCSSTGDFSDGAYYSSDGTSCQQCSTNQWLNSDADNCKKPQVCTSGEWLDATEKKLSK